MEKDSKSVYIRQKFLSFYEKKPWKKPNIKKLLKNESEMTKKNYVEKWVCVSIKWRVICLPSTEYLELPIKTKKVGEKTPEYFSEIQPVNAPKILERPLKNALKVAKKDC